MAAPSFAGRTGLGCQRLAPLPDEQAARVIHAALDCGVTIFDTADAYHRPAKQGGQAHDGERQLAAALRAHPQGPRAIVTTKVGLVQTGGRWREVGTRKHILAEAEKSRLALDTDRLDVLQLHAFDPRTKPRTSLRALQHAKEQGLAARIGICNVNATKLAQALDEAELDVVQVGLDLSATDAIRGGLLELARARGLDVLLYRPLGGVTGARRLGKDRALSALTKRPHAAAFSYLRDRVPGAVWLPGPSTVEHVQDLFDHERSAHEHFDQQHPAFGLVARPLLSRRPETFREGDVVLIMGAPGAGKTFRAEHYEKQGYARLNRDKRGGRLSELLAPLDEILEKDAPRVVLDNTYKTRAQRHAVVERAFAHGVAPRVEWVDTDVDRCLSGVAERLIRQTGHLPGPDEMKVLRSTNPQAFGPSVVRDYFRDLEPPDVQEGFVAIQQRGRTVEEREGPEVWVWDADALDPAGDGLRAAVHTHCEQGGLVILTMFRPGAEDEALQIEQARWRAALGEGVTFAVCRHRPPPRCWCMKPLPGAIIEQLWRQDALQRPGVVLGQSAADRTLARRLGFAFRSAPV